jgi:uncharacterized protein
MDVDWLRILAELGIGLFTGLLSGTMGIGGGIVMVPAMTMLLGIEQHTAQGVSLVVIVPTAIVGATTHFRLGNVDLKTALALGVFSIGGGLLGSQVAQGLDRQWLQLLFGIFLLFTGGRMIGLRLGGKQEKKTDVSTQPTS